MSGEQEQVIGLLMTIQKDIGELKGTVNGFHSSLATHVEDDKAMAASVKNLELAGARQRGAMRVFAAIATAVGSIVGAAVSHFITKGH